MRILVVSPTPSHPQDAGNRARIHALLSSLKTAGHAIHLCLLARENPSAATLAAMREAWDEVFEVPHDRSRELRSLGDLNALDDWILPETEQAFATLAEREPGFDLILVEYVFLSRAFDFFPRHIPHVLDTHDIFAGRAERLAALGLENRFFATTEVEENRGLDRADLVLAIQAEEARALAGRTRAVVMTLGHLPWDDRPPLPPRESQGPVAVGYLGSPNPLNTRALGRFLAALDPAALAVEGGEVVVAGAAARDLAASPGLRPIGPVADADVLYAQADLVVNPHEGGTGLKIKTVEALARGRAVIGTAEAFAGLPAEAPFHAAADAAELAAITRACVTDPALRETVAAGSTRLAARYTAEVSAARAALACPAALARLLDRPRLLLVTDVPFWQARLGNHQRIAALAGAARMEMDLDLFFAGALGGAERHAAQRLLGPRARVFATSPCTPADAPWGLSPFERTRFDGAIFAALAAHLRRHPPHAMLVEYIRLSYLRRATQFPEPLTVLDTHDVMSLRAQNFRHFGLEHFIRLSTSEELRILDAFNLVLAIQPEEAAWLERLLPNRVILAPHALPALPRARGSDQARPRIGFLGGDSPMNRDGLLWLLDQVWPAIVPLGAELHIAGSVCTRVPAGREGVVLHGEVADHHAFLCGLDIAMNPVFFGGGLKIKTVEYLAHGLPSVLTAEALFGIAGGHPTAYTVAADRDAFVAGLAALVRDAPARARMGAAAQAFARRHFGPRALDPAMRALAGLARGITRPEPASLVT
ncbi:MAG TPA: glycosyltransferase [Falsiroseomonas sp.]|jgi:glycosyltransferase involved in cell wall biosynthesis|nr:glycosyltransferase [Falsiroseomonas sp.]